MMLPLYMVPYWQPCRWMLIEAHVWVLPTQKHQVYKQEMLGVPLHTTIGT